MVSSMAVDGTLTDTIIPVLSVLESNGNKWVPHIFHCFMTGASPSDDLVSYLGDSFGPGSYTSVDIQSPYSTVPENWVPSIRRIYHVSLNSFVNFSFSLVNCFYLSGGLKFNPSIG